MNQIRNLITTNLFSLLVLWGIYTITQKANTEFAFLEVFFGIAISLIITVLTMLFYSKALNYEESYDYPPVAAPFTTLVTLLLGCAYLLKRLKMVKSNNYNVFAYYNHGSIFIFYFDFFKIQVLDEILFDGKPEESERLVALIDKHYNYGLMGSDSKLNFNFRYWDGMLDEAARRKDTIDNIKNS